jgi:small subunit ribosomal protein S14
MAKRSKIANNEQLRKLVARYTEWRAELKEIIRRPFSTREVRAVAVCTLQRLPRDSRPIRVRNRDAIDGWLRGHRRTFGLSRVRVREFVPRGEFAGVADCLIRLGESRVWVDSSAHLTGELTRYWSA